LDVQLPNNPDMQLDLCCVMMCVLMQSDTGPSGIQSDRDARCTSAKASHELSALSATCIYAAILKTTAVRSTTLAKQATLLPE